MKKILLKTLLPLATVGISLGTVLPLVSCSCGGSVFNVDEVAFNTANDLKNYMKQNIPNPEAQDFTQSPYDGDDENPQMIAWVLNHLDTKNIILGLMFSAFLTLSNNGYLSLDICIINFKTFDIALQVTTNNNIYEVNEHAYKNDEGINLQEHFIIYNRSGEIVNEWNVPLSSVNIKYCDVSSSGYKRIAIENSSDSLIDGLDHITFPNDEIWTNVIFPSA